MSRSARALAKNAPKACGDATLVAKALKKSGCNRDADTIMRLVHNHAEAGRKLAGMTAKEKSQ